MAVVYYIDQGDLEDALGKNVVIAVFDDDGDGIPEDSAIQACCASATASCNSFLRGHYTIDLPPAVISDELKFAALDFGIAYAIRRRPDVVKAMNAESWTVFRDSAIDQLKRYATAEQRLAVATGTPDAIGAKTGDNTIRCNSPLLSKRPGGHWDDFGDF